MAADERVLCLTTLAEDSVGLALGTAQGVVKRVNPEVLGRDVWEVIRLEPADRVVGAMELTSAASELVFITNDAQLLHSPPQPYDRRDCSGGGMAGVKLGIGASAVFFGARQATLPWWSRFPERPRCPEPTLERSRSPASEYPGKGRATGGVRCHRFLKGEDVLLFGWAGPGPALAAAASGTPITLPPADGRRDGSGSPASQPIAAAGSPAGA